MNYVHKNKRTLLHQIFYHWKKKTFFSLCFIVPYFLMLRKMRSIQDFFLILPYILNMNIDQYDRLVDSALKHLKLSEYKKLFFCTENFLFFSLVSKKQKMLQNITNTCHSCHTTYSLPYAGSTFFFLSQSFKCPSSQISDSSDQLFHLITQCHSTFNSYTSANVGSLN